MSTRVLNLPHGVTVNVSQPYAEGHVLSALEAEKLNHVLADNIRTSLMSKLKRLEDVDAEKVGAEFQSYADSYSFVVRSPKSTVDPITKEAMKIAKEQVLAAIRSKGGDPKDYPAEKIAEYVSLVLQKKPEIREEAARRIASSREMASDLLPDFFDEAA